jgi:hypothetical protein
MKLTRITVVSLALCSLAAQGCLSMLQRGSTSSSSSSAGYTGEVTVENRSQSNICSIAWTESGPTSYESAVQLGPGQRASFTARARLHRLQFAECETGRLLYGSPLAWINERETVPGNELQVGRVIVLDPGAAPVSEAGVVSVSLVAHESQEVLRDAFYATMAQRAARDESFMADGPLASQLLTMLQRGAAAQGWTERFEAVVISVPDWRIVQRRQGQQMITIARDLQFVGGARWPNGHCSLQSFGARQPFDGDEPQGAVGFNGIGDQVVIPCSLLTAMSRYPNAATGE